MTKSAGHVEQSIKQPAEDTHPHADLDLVRLSRPHERQDTEPIRLSAADTEASSHELQLKLPQETSGPVKARAANIASLSMLEQLVPDYGDPLVSDELQIMTRNPKLTPEAKKALELGITNYNKLAGTPVRSSRGDEKFVLNPNHMDEIASRNPELARAMDYLKRAFPDQATVSVNDIGSKIDYRVFHLPYMEQSVAYDQRQVQQGQSVQREFPELMNRFGYEAPPPSAGIPTSKVFETHNNLPPGVGTYVAIMERRLLDIQDERSGSPRDRSITKESIEDAIKNKKFSNADRRMLEDLAKNFDAVKSALTDVPPGLSLKKIREASLQARDRGSGLDPTLDYLSHMASGGNYKNPTVITANDVAAQVDKSIAGLQDDKKRLSEAMAVAAKLDPGATVLMAKLPEVYREIGKRGIGLSAKDVSRAIDGESLQLLKDHLTGNAAPRLSNEVKSVLDRIFPTGQNEAEQRDVLQRVNTAISNTGFHFTGFQQVSDAEKDRDMKHATRNLALVSPDGSSRYELRSTWNLYFHPNRCGGGFWSMIPESETDSTRSFCSE